MSDEVDGDEAARLGCAGFIVGAVVLALLAFVGIGLLFAMIAHPPLESR